MADVDVVDRLIEGILNEDVNAIAACYTDDGVVDHPLYPKPARGHDAIRAHQQILFDAFSDISVDVRSRMEGENVCAAEVVLRATNTGPIDVGAQEPIPATGKRIETRDVWVLDLTPEGLITEERHYMDVAAHMRQLGLAG